MIRFILCLAFLCVGQPIAKAEPPQAKPIEFQGEEIGSALRTLAIEAKINLVVNPKAKGTITVKLVDKTPMEAIRIICQAQGMTLNEKDGVHYMLYREEMSQLFHFLNSAILPETLARFKKRYFDALIKEGFTNEQALKIITSDQLPLNDSKIQFSQRPAPAESGNK